MPRTEIAESGQSFLSELKRCIIAVQQVGTTEQRTAVEQCVTRLLTTAGDLAPEEAENLCEKARLELWGAMIDEKGAAGPRLLFAEQLTRFGTAGRELLSHTIVQNEWQDNKLLAVQALRKCMARDAITVEAFTTALRSVIADQVRLAVACALVEADAGASEEIAPVLEQFLEFGDPTVELECACKLLALGFHKQEAFAVIRRHVKEDMDCQREEGEHEDSEDLLGELLQAFINKSLRNLRLFQRDDSIRVFRPLEETASLPVTLDDSKESEILVRTPTCDAKPRALTDIEHRSTIAPPSTPTPMSELPKSITDEQLVPVTGVPIPQVEQLKVERVLDEATSQVQQTGGQVAEDLIKGQREKVQAEIVGSRLIRIPDKEARLKAIVAFYTINRPQLVFPDDVLGVTQEHIQVLKNEGIPFEYV